ncbi:hypothetical protein P7K49_028180 [Saguinus oedipus]|uniref:Uncharacterized protein n=1 Tax=Saguinus oedipus TaxID=9490 RepID=A0ABQ9UBK2_SAGOE|nr:hypothetical protein P7K49_028180 [Saguinus oedipus]
MSSGDLRYAPVSLRMRKLQVNNDKVMRPAAAEEELWKEQVAGRGNPFLRENAGQESVPAYLVSSMEGEAE